MLFVTCCLQAVWISNYTHDKHEALKNSLNEVGIQLYSSSSSTDISSTGKYPMQYFCVWQNASYHTERKYRFCTYHK